MKFLIVTHTAHVQKEDKYYAYAPYVKEMNIWLKQVDELIIVAPLETDKEPTAIDAPYTFDGKISFIRLRAFNFKSMSAGLGSLVVIPFNMVLIVRGMIHADHIHLRCPGNVGLLGAFSQMLFPKKNKTAKYAGNWSNYPHQPLSYVWQKKILSSAFLTRNIRVLIYGQWPEITKNLKPFFTATYSQNEIEPLRIRKLDGPIEFLFVGTLTKNKNPILAALLVQLFLRNKAATLRFIGDGPELESLKNVVNEADLGRTITFHNFVNAENLKLIYQQAHFCVLLSDSEGWPKAIAEAMFWGCIPVASPVSCVPWMLANGNRGVLVNRNDLEGACKSLLELVNNPSRFHNTSEKASQWSKQYTMERFESEIRSFI